MRGTPGDLVEARQHSLDTVTVTFDQVFHPATIPPLALPDLLLGSGHAGVGNLPVETLHF
jgi:hypothetical protein